MTRLNINSKSICLCLITIASAFYFLLYSPGLFEGFSLIDDVALAQAPQLRAPITLGSLIGIATIGSQIDYYVVRDLSYLADIHLFGGKPQAFRLHQFALFFFTTIAIFFLSCELGASPLTAFAATALWAFNASDAEMLMWISARKDVLAILFMVLSSLCYLKALKSKSYLQSTLSVLFFIFSLQSKATFSGLPFVALSTIIIFYKQFRNRFAITLTTLLCSLGTFSSVFQSWFYSHINDMRLVEPYSYRIQASSAALGKMFLGWFFPSLNVVDVVNWSPWLDYNKSFVGAGVILWLSLIGMTFWSFAKGRAILFTICLAVGLTYLPISGLLFPHRNFYSVRYFIPLILILLLGFSITSKSIFAKVSPLLKIAFALAVVLVYGFNNAQEGKTWSDAVLVAKKALRNQPQNEALKVTVYEELSRLAHSKLPPPQLVSELGQLQNEVAHDCEPQFGHVFHTQGDFCWRYYLLQWNHDMRANNFAGATTQLKSLRQSFETRSPQTQLVPVAFATNEMFFGSVNLAHTQEWLADLKWVTDSTYRVKQLLALCLIRGPESVAPVLKKYVAHDLISRDDLYSSINRDVSYQYRTKVASCFGVRSGIAK